MQANNRLTPLWANRESLTEAEWDELYRLIVSILSKSNPSILRSLPESKEHYIQDFFLLKVFEPAKHDSNSPHGANELCSYFNNYLIDVYRSAALRTSEEYDEEVLPHDGTLDHGGEVDSEFRDFGYTPQKVQASAQEFLRNLDEIGRIYLALHTCADTPEPLYKLAERLRIPSYHYRAHQLGITRKKGEFGDDYESTEIGRWLVKVLGLDLSANAAVLSALKILCFESLQQYQIETELR